MPHLTLTRKEERRRVHSFCCRCIGGHPHVCQTRTCELWDMRLGWQEDPDQTHLLKVCDMDVFTKQVVEKAASVGLQRRDFGMDHVRAIYPAEPLSCHWWGGVVRRREWLDRFESLAFTHKSSGVRRRHGRSLMWRLRQNPDRVSVVSHSDETIGEPISGSSGPDFLKIPIDKRASV